MIDENTLAEIVRKAVQEAVCKPLRPWHSVAQVAKNLGVEQAKVRGWIRSGELPASNVAAKLSQRPRWKISQESLDSFLQKRQAVPRQPVRTRPRRPDYEKII
jgi:transposase